MKLLQLIGLAACLVSTATSAPQASPEAPGISVPSPPDDGAAAMAAGSNPPYNVGKLYGIMTQVYGDINRSNFDTLDTMRRLFKEGIPLTNEIRQRLRSNFANVAAKNLMFAQALERQVAAMAALAPPGKPYGNITLEEVADIWQTLILVDRSAEWQKVYITDKKGGKPYIRPFLWKFTSKEILLSQANLRRTIAPFAQLVDFVRASMQPEWPFWYRVIEYFIGKVGPGSNLDKFVNWPPPPAGRADSLTARDDDDDDEGTSAVVTSSGQ